MTKKQQLCYDLFIFTGLAGVLYMAFGRRSPFEHANKRVVFALHPVPGKAILGADEAARVWSKIAEANL